MDDGCEITKKMRGGWSHVQVLFAPSGLGFGYMIYLHKYNVFQWLFIH